MWGVFIGRFQPFHTGHLHIIKQALQACEQVIIVVGSHGAARSLRNPFVSSERIAMMKQCFLETDQKRLHFVEVHDHLYQPELWQGEIKQKVGTLVNKQAEIKLILPQGCKSNAKKSQLFPDWPVLLLSKEEGPAAHALRDTFLRDAATITGHKQLPPAVQNWLQAFAQTPIYRNLALERHLIDEYKQSWAAAPYPPIFVTADTLVVQANHVLLIRRAQAPGKGLLALPGGFLDQQETLESCALRELKEETNFPLSEEALLKCFMAAKVFDAPCRSVRGRTITHVHYFYLGENKQLPVCEAADDASQVFWMPLAQLEKFESEFFEDHYHIINIMNKTYPPLAKE